MADSRINWKAGETESIEPFAISRTALDGTAIRFRPADQFQSIDNHYVEGPEFWDEFMPELRIELDIDSLVGDTGISGDDVLVSVILRDRVLNRFRRIAEWPLALLPNDPISLSDSWIEYSHSDRIDICVVASPVETADRGSGIARNQSDILCRQVFKIRGTAQSTKIPHRWATPEEFEARGVSADTIWMVDWVGEDLERPIADNVVIWINERHKDKFMMLEDQEFGDLFRREMAAGIFLEFAVRTLADRQMPQEQDGMRQVILDLLCRISKLETEELFVRMEQPDYQGFLHAWTQSYVGLNDAFLKL